MLKSIFIQVVGTVIGPLKKHIGRDVLVSELDVGDPVPIHSQVEKELSGIIYQLNTSHREDRSVRKILFSKERN